MKEQFFLWLISVLVITLVIGNEDKKKNDEDDSYEVRSSDIDEHDEATTRMLELINNAAMEIIDAPDLSKAMVYLFCFVIYLLTLLIL